MEKSRHNCYLSYLFLELHAILYCLIGWFVYSERQAKKNVFARVSWKFTVSHLKQMGVQRSALALHKIMKHLVLKLIKFSSALALYNKRHKTHTHKQSNSMEEGTIWMNKEKKKQFIHALNHLLWAEHCSKEWQNNKCKKQRQPKWYTLV